MTKNTTLKTLKEIEQQAAAIRFLVSAFRVMGLIEAGKGEDGTPTSFVDPAWKDRLAILQRGFLGRFKWLFLGK